MASLVRRIEIRIMKRAGYSRENWILDRKGNPVTVKRDGEITDPDDTPIGRDWPVRLPARVKAATRPVKHNPVVRALRKAKPNSKRLAQWAKRVSLPA